MILSPRPHIALAAGLLASVLVGCNKKSATPGSPAQKSSAADSVATGAANSTNEKVASSEPDTRPAAQTVSPREFDCRTLDYGLYWFGKGDLAQKASAATKSSFYDPTKPTVIYVHGWQAGSHNLGKRATFNYSKADPIYGPKVDEADAWIDAGWNIGIFYWNQFSDELIVNDAENKIWEDEPVTWKNCDGKAVSTGVPSGNMADILFATYQEALKDYQGPNIRLAGHSLGNQLVTRLAAKAAEAAKQGKISSALVPKRVALLDPYWSRETSKMPNRATQTRALITDLKAQGMIFEWYKTSSLLEASSADTNSELLTMIGDTEITPAYYSVQALRHGAAPYLYFLSFANPPPKGCQEAGCTVTAPSAATNDARMLELMNAATQWKIVAGMNTADTADNVFVPLK